MSESNERTREFRNAMESANDEYFVVLAKLYDQYGDCIPQHLKDTWEESEVSLDEKQVIALKANVVFMMMESDLR